MKKTAVLLIVFFVCVPALYADITYQINLNRTAVPADVFMKKLTLKVNVGTCTSCLAYDDGVSVPATYNTATKECIFTVTGNTAVVTGVGAATGATGAFAKATLYNNKKWAYSFTFDDGYRTIYTVGAPVLAERGYKGGVAINPGFFGTSDPNDSYLVWSEVDAIRSTYGWSIFNHSQNHVGSGYSLIGCSDPTYNLNTEVKPVNDAANPRFTDGYKITHYVYPFNDMPYEPCLRTSGLALSAESVTGDQYVDTMIPETGDDWGTNVGRFKLRRHQFYGTDINTFNGWASGAANDTNGTRWLISFTHAVTPGSAVPPSIYFTNEATLRSHMTYIYTNFGEGGNNSMWFAPTDEVMHYLLTREYTTLARVSVTPVTPVTLTPTYTPTVTVSPTPSNTPTLTRTSTVTATPTATVCGETVIFRINCGGAQYVDVSGFTWAADSNFSGGTADSISNTINIANTLDDTLFQSERYGASSYNFTVNNGTYKVRLLFAEIYYTTTLSRRFNVTAEGTTMLTNLDLVAQVGPAAAYEQTFTVNVSDGQLNLAGVVGSADLPKWSAIEVRSVVSCLTPTYTTTNTPSNTATATATRTATTTSTRTMTPTNTPTSTPTNTYTASVTATNSGTATLTNTPSNTPTQTNTRTSTATNSATNTATLTNTRTATPTNTPTETDTVTLTFTQTFTATQTYTGSPLPTWTYTDTPTTTFTRTETSTRTYTATATATGTATFTSTPTNSMTFTNTPTITWTVTMPATWTYTNTPTNTSTPTFTNTQVYTFTYTATATSTWTFSNTPSPTVTYTFTFTPTFTRTHTATASATATWTYTPTLTYTFTNTNTPVFTATYTATPTNTPELDILLFEKDKPVVNYPNPAKGDFTVRFSLTKSAARLNMKFYTVAGRKIKELDAAVPLSAGENDVMVTKASTANLGNGTYYYLIEASDKEGRKAKSDIGVLILLR